MLFPFSLVPAWVHQLAALILFYFFMGIAFVEMATLRPYYYRRDSIKYSPARLYSTLLNILFHAALAWGCFALGEWVSFILSYGLLVYIIYAVIMILKARKPLHVFLFEMSLVIGIVS